MRFGEGRKKWLILSGGRVLAILLGVLCGSNAPVSAMDLEEAAKAFGTMPGVSGALLSPDGQRVSFITHSTKHDVPIAMTVNLGTGGGAVVAASDPKKADVQWCAWANDSRLLCGFYGVMKFNGKLADATRLVAANYDGSGMSVLAQSQQRGLFSMDQAEIVDLLPDDRDHILMEIQDKDGGEGVSRVNIYKNKLRPVERPRPAVWNWWSDGRGNLRLKTVQSNTRKMELKFRAADDRSWQQLHVWEFADLDDKFDIVGFGDSPNELYVLDSHEGRVALFRENLGPERGRELVFAHPEVDVDGGAVSLGRHQRIVGVTFTTDRSRVKYFDASAESIHNAMTDRFPGESVTLLSESWNREFYLVHVSSDLNSGVYYRYEPATGEVRKVTGAYPALEDVSLSPMRLIEYPSDDGVMISGYVTASEDSVDGPRPTIILPHGGPQSRDEWGYDFLAQFLASRGYVVLQSNYRGSGGFGSDWSGDGAYREWKRAMKDLEFGARYLVEKKISDPARICTVGWSYGGYAALMSALEYPDRYQCVVSIAGVTDPVKLVRSARGGSRRFRRAQIGDDPIVVKEGSAVRRAEEMKPPVLLFHGENDINVAIEHSERMDKALRREKKEVEFFEYEDIDHQFRRNKERIDMLEKMGRFLEEHLKPRVTATAEAPAGS